MYENFKKYFDLEEEESSLFKLNEIYSYYCETNLFLRQARNTLEIDRDAPYDETQAKILAAVN